MNDPSESSRILMGPEGYWSILKILEIYWTFVQNFVWPWRVLKSFEESWKTAKFLNGRSICQKGVWLTELVSYRAGYNKASTSTNMIRISLTKILFSCWKMWFSSFWKLALFCRFFYFPLKKYDFTEENSYFSKKYS